MSSGRIVPVHTTSEALNLALTAHKSLLSEYALRTRQAEQMANTLLNDRMPPEVMMNAVVELMKEHSESRAKERAVQQQAMLQATLAMLEQASTIQDLETLRSLVNNVAKQITVSLGHMNTTNPSNKE